MSKVELEEPPPRAAGATATKRLRQINISVSDEEYQAIQLAADIVEVSVTELVRLIATGICDPKALNARHARPALIVMDARLNRVELANRLAHIDPRARVITAGESR